MHINVKKFVKSFIVIAFVIGLFGIVFSNRKFIWDNIYGFFVKDVKVEAEDVEEVITKYVGLPTATSKTVIENLNMKYEVLPYEDDAIVPEYSINLGSALQYADLKGITTFRGNNYRDTASYGTVEINENIIEKVWGTDVGAVDTWTGVGWNGQPAIVQWEDDVKQDMNLYDKFKVKDNFKEVIYGTLDSYVYFYDLETGEQTRPLIKVNSSIKGSVTIDPRGLPLLYVGQGIDKVGEDYVPIGYYIFSLITGEQLYFINGIESFAYRKWGAFDGNPVIDSNTDTIILPGENGIIYIGKLNTNYDKKNGTISINPQINRYRYTTSKNNAMLGTENAMTVYKNYAYFLDNAGILQCLDLNTFTPIWANAMGDDSDSTLGLEEENGKVVLYTGSEVDLQGRDGVAYIRKIDGYTGEIIWEKGYNCYYDSEVNGGVLSSPIVGKNEIDDLVIFNIAKTGSNVWRGKMVAFHKLSGAVVWEKDLDIYSWSSPVAVYNEEGKAYLVFCDALGQIFLIDGITGETLFTYDTKGGNIEGSPAVFNDMIVVGTRGKQVYGLKIK